MRLLFFPPLLASLSPPSGLKPTERTMKNQQDRSNLTHSLPSGPSGRGGKNLPTTIITSGRKTEDDRCPGLENYKNKTFNTNSCRLKACAQLKIKFNGTNNVTKDCSIENKRNLVLNRMCLICTSSITSGSSIRPTESGRLGLLGGHSLKRSDSAGGIAQNKTRETGRPQSEEASQDPGYRSVQQGEVKHVMQRYGLHTFHLKMAQSTPSESDATSTQASRQGTPSRSASPFLLFFVLSGSAFGVRSNIAACYDSVQTTKPP